MDPSKILEVFLPKLLTERVLLGVALLILFTEDYLLISHQANLAWLDQALPKLSTSEILYFLMALAFSWLCVFPSLKAIATILYVMLPKGKSYSDPFKRLTITELLAQAVDKQNSVAYQHFKAHVKHMKEQQVVRELYFYILVLAIVNLCFRSSLIQHTFLSHPLITLLPFLLLVYLGISVGIVGAVDNDDSRTDVRPITSETSGPAAPPMLSAN